MLTELIQSGITSPDFSQKLITRDRLINQLVNNLNKNLIFVYSPAGYGKTTLIKSLLSKQNWEHCWFNASPEHNHIYTFLRYLIFSLQKLDYTFGYNTLQMIESRRERFQLSGAKQKSIIDEIMHTFIKEFNDVFKEDTILVIDNLQNIEESPWFIEIFNSLFSNFPKKLHLILLTRYVHDFNFIPLIEKEQMFKLGMEDLIFRFDEIVELLNKIYTIKYSEGGIKLLEQNLGGWITGIHMILQSFGKDFESIKFETQSIPENTFNILAEEIYKRLDENTQKFLVFSSVLDNFSSGLCAYIFDDKNCGKIIRKLAEKHQFIQLEDSCDGSNKFKFQLLFKSFLNQKLRKNYSEDVIYNLIKKAAEYHHEHKDIIQATNYYLRAKDYQSAIKLIIENFRTLFDEGKFECLWKWMTTIEAETEIKNPHLVYYSGCLCKYYMGDLKRALEYLEESIEMFKAENNQKCLASCYVTKAGVLLNFGKTAEVINNLSDLIEKENTPDIKANLLYFMAYSYYMNSNYEKTAELLQHTLKISNNGDTINKKNSIYNLLGNIELIKGNFSESFSYYEKAIESKPSLFNRFETLCNLVLLSSQNGKYKKAYDYLKKLNNLILNFESPVFKIPFMLSKQAYLFESLEYKENIEVLQEINTIALTMNHKQYIYLTNRLLSDTYYYLNDLEKSKKYFELAVETVDNDNELEKIELSTIEAQLKLKTSDEAYETILKKAYEYYDKNDYVYSKAQIGYRIANMYYQNGDFHNALNYLKECLETAQNNGYVSFFVREYAHSKDILDFALKNNIYSEFVSSIFSNIKTV